MNKHDGLTPVFNYNKAICFECDNNYFKYLFVAIQSIFDFSTEENFYDIVILSYKIDQRNIDLLTKIFSKSNFSIRFININIAGNNNIFYTSGHVTNTTYFRFFIPKIFMHYQTVLHVDCDVIVKSDISELLNIDIGDKLCGVFPEIDRLCGYTNERIQYNKNILNIDNLHYFCAGVMCFNIKKCCEFELTKKCIDMLIKVKTPLFHDQDILNSVTFGKNIELPSEWHVMIGSQNKKNYSKQLKLYPNIMKKYLDDMKNPKLIHYGGVNKPWNFIPIEQYYCLWWDIARRTPLYELFITELNYKHQRIEIEKIKHENKKQVDILKKQIDDLRSEISKLKHYVEIK